MAYKIHIIATDINIVNKYIDSIDNHRINYSIHEFTMFA